MIKKKLIATWTVNKSFGITLHHTLAKMLIDNIVKPKWVVDHDGCLGLRILGVNLVYYKHPEPTVSFQGGWRYTEELEFGEVILTELRE